MFFLLLQASGLIVAGLGLAIAGFAGIVLFLFLSQIHRVIHWYCQQRIGIGRMQTLQDSPAAEGPPVIILCALIFSFDL